MKKGATLVEILVATLIFSIFFGCCLTSYLLSFQAVQKEKEYVEFTTICYNINTFYEEYGTSWNEKFFGNEGVENTYYYNYDFHALEQEHAEDEEIYSLVYEINEDNELIICIKNVIKDYLIIDSLNFGGVTDEENKTPE